MFQISQSCRRDVAWSSEACQSAMRARRDNNNERRRGSRRTNPPRGQPCWLPEGAQGDIALGDSAKMPQQAYAVSTYFFQSGSEHRYHFEYERPLAFANVVTTLAFSRDGRWLFSGTSSGIVKVWDTVRWAETARLKGVVGEELGSIVISPSQRYIVIVQPSCMHVYECQPPWNLEKAILPTCGNVELAEGSPPPRWLFAAFSPADRWFGESDDEIAAVSSCGIAVVDCCQGWNFDEPRRSHSIQNSASRPTAFVYTACGNWLSCSYEDGRIEIWGLRPLSRERVLRKHSGSATCLLAMPNRPGTDPHLVSCGTDGNLCVWNVASNFTLQQVAYDEERRNPDPLTSCSFSADSQWLVAVGLGLYIWRVVHQHSGVIDLLLHQSLDGSVSGVVPGLRAAAFGARSLGGNSPPESTGHLAVSSRDGALLLWKKIAGSPAHLLPSTGFKSLRSVAQKGTDEDSLPSGACTPTSPQGGRKAMSAVVEPPMLCEGLLASADLLPANRWGHAVHKRPATPISVLERMALHRRKTHNADGGIQNHSRTLLLAKPSSLSEAGCGEKASTPVAAMLERSTSMPQLVGSPTGPALERWAPVRFDFSCATVKQRSSPTKRTSANTPMSLSKTASQSGLAYC
eukprot:TRINITY_DN10036_c0_g1_i1.p1 TRINITY_DN10036_c0_g1~~TRINITY_DN10036_c0_g1_i1.p1  ORF type:complete len:630 (-),score=107.09 TRINITY_DN10036_c0_g1_i1:151-2040(-)